jgi:hypothetical protein
MSRKRGRSTRQGQSGSRRAWNPPASPYGPPGADEDIADSGGNPDDVRLTVTAKLVVRVTRPEILRKYAADAQRAMTVIHCQHRSKSGSGPYFVIVTTWQ